MPPWVPWPSIAGSAHSSEDWVPAWSWSPPLWCSTTTWSSPGPSSTCSPRLPRCFRGRIASPLGAQSVSLSPGDKYIIWWLQLINRPWHSEKKWDERMPDSYLLLRFPRNKLSKLQAVKSRILFCFSPSFVFGFVHWRHVARLGKHMAKKMREKWGGQMVV